MLYYTLYSGQHIVKLFKDADFRTDIFLVKNANVTISGTRGVGVLIGKFRGNKNFQTNTTTLVYRNRPKMFRISQMYPGRCRGAVSFGPC